MLNGSTCGAIVLGGGAGTRLSSGIPKQFLRVGGKLIIVRAIEGLLSSGVLSELVVVVHPDWIGEIERVLLDTELDVATSIVPGGTTRNHSTRAGLAALGSGIGIVMIHDAARPFIDGPTVKRCVQPIISGAADATDVVIPTSDTIVSVDDTGEWVVDVLRRGNLRRGQTPQTFVRPMLEAAYRAWSADTSPQVYTDDIGVLLGYEPRARVATVLGSQANLKITHVEDLMTADALLRQYASAGPFPAASLGPADGTAVFGGTSGIGSALVDRLLKEGVPVFAGSRRTGHDILTREGRLAFLRQATERLGQVRHLAICVGDLTVAPILGMSESDIDTQVRVNFLGPLLAARDAVQADGRSLDSITFLGSSSYTHGRAHYAVYSAAKAALVAATQALAEEWMEAGIRVNVLVPERTRTPMRTRHFGDESGPMLTADKVASEIITLISSGQTGVVVHVRDMGGI